MAHFFKKVAESVLFNTFDKVRFRKNGLSLIGTYIERQRERECVLAGVRCCVLSERKTERPPKKLPSASEHQNLKFDF